MKAQKAAACLIAGCLACGLVTAKAGSVSADAELPETVLRVERTAANADGSFTASVYLDTLPETGLGALEFVIAYDAAALSITGAELLYDTGAQNAQQIAYPDLAETVFTCSDDRGGMFGVRWATVLSNADYWLKEERPFFRLSGVLKDEMPEGACAELRIVPPAGLPADSDIPAGFLDTDNVIHRSPVTVQNGAIWKPIDETGATMYGDMNLDGQVTVSDAVMMQRAIAEELALSAAAYANADCEFDGLLTISDISLMLRYLTDDAGDVVLGAH